MIVKRIPEIRFCNKWTCEEFQCLVLVTKRSISFASTVSKTWKSCTTLPYKLTIYSLDSTILLLRFGWLPLTTLGLLEGNTLNVPLWARGTVLTTRLNRWVWHPHVGHAPVTPASSSIRATLPYLHCMAQSSPTFHWNRFQTKST